MSACACCRRRSATVVRKEWPVLKHKMNLTGTTDSNNARSLSKIISLHEIGKSSFFVGARVCLCGLRLLHPARESLLMFRSLPQPAGDRGEEGGIHERHVVRTYIQCVVLENDDTGTRAGISVSNISCHCSLNVPQVAQTSFLQLGQGLE